MFLVYASRLESCFSNLNFILNACHLIQIFFDNRLSPFDNCLFFPCTFSILLNCSNIYCDEKFFGAIFFSFLLLLLLLFRISFSISDSIDFLFIWLIIDFQSVYLVLSLNVYCDGICKIDFNWRACNSIRIFFMYLIIVLCRF